MKPQVPLVLKFRDWPDSDKAAFLALFRNDDPFDGAGSFGHWSEGSFNKVRQSYGYWLSYLKSHSILTITAEISNRITRDAVLAYANDAASRVSDRTILNMLGDLYQLATAFQPEGDWCWYHKIVGKQRAKTPQWRMKPRHKTSAHQIYTFSLQQLEEISMAEQIDVSLAVRFRDALILAFLISLPIRARSFLLLEYGNQLIWNGHCFEVKLKPSETKDKKYHEFPLPDALTIPIRLYLDNFRMELLQGKHTQKFWVSARGAAYGYDTLNRHLAQLTHRVFGEAFRPHAFREIAATSIALANPEWAGIIPDLLGHASETYGEKIYNRATGIVAVTTHQGLIAQLRRAAKQATKINKPTGSDWP